MTTIQTALAAFIAANDDSVSIAEGIRVTRALETACSIHGNFAAAEKADELVRLFNELGGDPDGETTADLIRLCEAA